jgi:hypothetical protein
MRPPAEDARVAELFKSDEDARERQTRGEFRSDLDVGAVALVFFAASIAPVAFPWLARELTQDVSGLRRCRASQVCAGAGRRRSARQPNAQASTVNTPRVRPSAHTPVQAPVPYTAPVSPEPAAPPMKYAVM